MTSVDQIYLNGIDGTTGEYLIPPMTPAQAADMFRGTQPSGWLADWVKRAWKILQTPFLGLPMDVDPTDVARAGWAIVFHSDTPPEVKAALEPLIKHRQGRVPPDRCKVLEYRGNLSFKDWLAGYEVAPGTVNPKRVPYYVTVVGSPDQIPFDFQYLLDIEYAVGRIAFDTAEEYRQYAESIVHYETSATVPNGKEITYWATRHAPDRATHLSADSLITPLSEGTDDDEAIAGALGYRSNCLKARDATKARLLELLRGANGTPAMLFTASHGMGWPKGDARQLDAQGALLCQDWTGFGSIRAGDYLTGAEVSDDAKVHGLVAFLFACYGAGTPSHDNFLRDRNQGPLAIAEQPFVAALPRRLLSHPNGGALAVLGHVERAWGYSIAPPDAGPQLQPFRNLIGRILSGEPVGHATKDFSERYTALSAGMLTQLDETQPGPRPSDAELALAWIERNDAQNYVVLGDPAVQVRNTDLQ